MFQVDDGDRVLQFEGEHLAHSTSKRDDSPRWSEFDLYRTNGGSYVVSRVGYSNVYHTADCSVVSKGRHAPAQVATLTEDAVPCEECRPTAEIGQAHELIYPERPLPWAQACPTADAAIEALAKYDVDDNRYFTRVARQLATRAAKKDWRVRDAYYVEVVP